MSTRPVALGAFLDEDRALFTLQALTKASDAEDVRIESTKLKDYDIESQSGFQRWPPCGVPS